MKTRRTCEHPTPGFSKLTIGFWLRFRGDLRSIWPSRLESARGRDAVARRALRSASARSRARDWPVSCQTKSYRVSKRSEKCHPSTASRRGTRLRLAGRKLERWKLAGSKRVMKDHPLQAPAGWSNSPRWRGSETPRFSRVLLRPKSSSAASALCARQRSARFSSVGNPPRACEARRRTCEHLTTRFRSAWSARPSGWR
jgi:hypothetical protein